MIFALAGNQNCGKTTLFNQLTGSNQHVGNFPGVTVERKDGEIRGRRGVTVVDLPGIYSLSPYTSEEIVTRDFLLNQHPDGIINIVDATNIERNFYLSMQLIELNIPMVVALNMMDEFRANGGTIKLRRLSEELGVPVVPISAVKNEGIDELIETAIATARDRRRPARLDFCSGAVHRAIHAIAHLVEDHAERIGVPPRFAATKLVEGDLPMLERLELSQNEQDMVEHSVTEMETELGTDREAALADMRYSFIDSLCAQTVVKPTESREHLRSLRMDNVLTHKYLAIPIFLIIMLVIFWLTFGVIGTALSDLLSMGIDALTAAASDALTRYGLNPVIHSLVIDGIFAGVGSVLSFLPIIVVLFFFLSILEDSGYMARVAFIMDRIFRRFGLSGKSFIPMLISSGCGVPGVMATRTIENEKDRRLTIMTTTFIPCGAKLPIIALIAGAMFPNVTWMAPATYFFGIFMVVISGIILKKTKMFAGDPAPFVMELPQYHFPAPKGVLIHMWERGKAFIIKAGTVIFVACGVIWFLQSFGFGPDGFGMVDDENMSMLAAIGNVLAPIFAPLGFGNWQAAVASVSGLVAKENVVGTFGVLFGLGEVGEDDPALLAALPTLFATHASALAFMVFNLTCAPCFAAIGAIRREMNSAKWTWFAIGYMTGMAYVMAFIINQLGGTIFYGVPFGIGQVIALVLVAALLWLLFRSYKPAGMSKRPATAGARA